MATLTLSTALRPILIGAILLLPITTRVAEVAPLHAVQAVPGQAAPNVATAAKVPAVTKPPRPVEQVENREMVPLSDPGPSPKPSIVQTGMASWYGGEFIGGKTASGERYRAQDRTAAHRKLPFGTLIRVTNLSNQRTAVLRINNRGPFIKGRILDVSAQAAADLAMIKSGVAKVRVEVLPRPERIRS